MTEKNVPFTADLIKAIEKENPTPFYVYDKNAIVENARAFLKAFSILPGGFKNYFAVKALPNPRILEILKAEGMGADCSSLPELELAHRVGLSGEDIMFTSNDTPAQEFVRAKELGAVINLDDITHIETLKNAAGIPQTICFRYNPGPLKQGNALIGKPEEAKYGLTREQLKEGYRRMKAEGVKRFGLHTMVASNELNPDYFVETARILFELLAEIKTETGVEIDFINLGGGIGIPYKPEQNAVDLNRVASGIQKLYDELIIQKGLKQPKIVMECGRMVTGPFGYLVSKVLHKKTTYKNYVGLDACMANLMRPALYGAYHHITILGKENAPADYVCDVTGSLCENNDKFAIDRKLPEPEIGDIVVIHDGGAHGHAMGFNYNAKLRCAEFLWEGGERFQKIRRAETPDDYFATLSF